MKIIATVEQTQMPEVDALSHQFRTLGGSNKLVNGVIDHEFSAAGEMHFSQDAYQICIASGLQIDRAMMFTEQPATVLDELVPVVFPDSQDEEGNQITWRDYLFIFWVTDTGTILMKAAHHSMSTGLSDELRKVWHNNFGGLLTKVEGVALIPVVEE